MEILVTGGGGFVMSHLLRQWIARSDAHRAICVDVYPADAQWRKFIADHAGQVEYVEGSVAERALWEEALGNRAPDYLVHGAAMTPNRERSEKEQARAIVEVNIVGTLNALEWARGRASLRRVVHVSTGSIYGDDGPDGALPEDGYEARNPDSLYPITKRAGELLALRYRELFDLPLAVGRLSSIYGPMDRWTPGRDFVCAPNLIAHRALAGEAVRIAGAAAVGDWLHAGDVARGILALCDAPALRHDCFNIGYGEAISLAGLVDILGEILPGARFEETAPDAAEIVADPTRIRGASGAYDISRLRELGWSPTPIGEALADYVDWIQSAEIS